MPYLRDNMHRQNARNNVEVIIQTPTRLMFSDKFSNDIKKLYNELDKFIKITENEEKASENLYKLVHEIAVTQNNNYVEMLRALVENPTASCIEINIEDKNNLSSLVASLILRHC